MPKLRIEVEHHIRQIVVLDVTKDELANMTYDDALAMAPYDDLLPSVNDSYSEIEDVTVDGVDHWF